MKFKNISAHSYYFTPNIVTGPFHTELSLTKVFENCKIQFFGGTPPTNAVALNLTFADLDNPEKFTKILETEPFQVISSYDPDKRKRYIRKSIVDAQELRYTGSGTITWAAIRIKNPETEVEYIIITPSIGTWGQSKMPILLDNKVGALNTKNIFKSFSLELNDRIN